MTKQAKKVNKIRQVAKNGKQVFQASKNVNRIFQLAKKGQQNNFIRHAQ